MKAGDKTKLAILETGLRLWRVDPSYVTARRIAKELGMTHGGVIYHFRDLEHTIKDAIAYHAVEQGESRVIAHLIAGRHPSVNGLSDADRLEHMRIASEAIKV